MSRTTWFAASSLLLVAFLLRLPQIVEPIGIDQGIFATAAWGLSRGLMLYRDLWDQKPPGIHLAYLAAFQVFGVRPASIVWLDIAASAATSLLLIEIGRRSSSLRAGLFAAAAYALLTLPAARYAAGGFHERAMPEHFLVPLVAGAVVCATAMRHATRLTVALLLGVLIGGATLFKPTALVYWPVLLAWLAAVRPGVLTRRLVLVSAIGVLGPVCAVVGWLAWRGVLGDAWVAVVDYNRAYLPGGLSFGAAVDRFAHELWRRSWYDPLWILGGAGALWGLLRTARDRAAMPPVWLGIAWVAGAAAGAAANGIRSFNSYFVPMLPGMALLGGWLLAWPWQTRRRTDGAVAALVLSVALIVTVRAGYVGRTVDAVGADVARLTGREPDELRFLERFGHYRVGQGYSARANAELTAYLVAHTNPADTVYIFGMAPSVYFTSRRLPANRFLWVYPPTSHLLAKSGFQIEDLTAELDRAAPSYLVLERYNRDSLTGWTVEALLTARAVRRLLEGYRQETEIEDFVVYRRAATTPVAEPRSAVTATKPAAAAR